MNPLLTQFLVEAREHIQAATDGLLGLERAPDHPEIVNGVFRSIHTLKGASGLFEYPAMTRVLHASEDLFVALREGRLRLEPAMLDQVLDVLDLVSAWLDSVERTEALPHDADAVAVPKAATIRAWLNPEAAATAPAAIVAAGATADPCPAWIGGLDEPLRMEAADRALALGQPVLAIAYAPEAQCFFKGDDPLALARQIPERVALQLAEPDSWGPVAEMDPFTCRVGVRALSLAPRSEVDGLFRYVAEQVEIVELPALALAGLTGAGDTDPLFDDFAQDAGALLARGERARLAEAAGTVLGLANPDRPEAAALRWIQRFAGNAAVDDAALAGLLRPLGAVAGSEDAGAPAPARFGARVARLLRAQDALLRTPCAEEQLDGRIGAAGTVAANALRHEGRAEDAARMRRAADEAAARRSPEPILTLLHEAMGGEEPEAPRATTDTPPARAAARTEEAHERPALGAQTVLRVDQAKVDALMNLIGELVVAKNGLPFLARRAENQYECRELAREIKDHYGVIDRIAQELRGAIMQVRMLPVSTVFQRFPRLVRDLARKLDKRVELVIHGEDTQADKTVIENLFDPLLHLVRNSLDHGIEGAADRLAAGKPETATLRLEAEQDNDQVVIRIVDDGRGIDAGRVRRKAVERGLLAPEQAERMSDAEAVQLIFAPGFSTAEQVSDVSGRGVGMDAVRNAVEGSGGRVEVSSVAGTGTTVSLILPLSMAVTRVMTVTAGGRPFGIPMDQVIETVRVPMSDIVQIRHNRAFVLRDRIVPLLRLSDLLGVERAVAETADEESILVVRVDKETMGLAIDTFGEGLELIVKPMEGILAATPGYAGTALLGDGSVLLVLDLGEVVR